MIKLTERQYLDADESNTGFCLACKAEAGPVEPDARRYLCEVCGKRQVYGVSELLIMGQLDITDLTD